MSRPPFVVSGYSIAELLFCVSNGNLHMLHRECRVMIRVAALLLCCGPLMAQYDPMAPEPVAKLRGSLLLHGGGPVSREVRETLVELAGGAKAKIVVVIAADGDGQIAEWKAMEPGSIEVVELTSLTGAPEAAILASLIEATGVWFESTYAAGVETDDRKPSIKTAIRAVIDRGGVVGGTSSGAVLASRVLRADGAEQMGLALLPGAIVSLPFREEASQDRLFQFVAAHSDCVGFGIPAETALLLRGRSLQVIGKSEVAVVLAASAQRPVRADRLAAGQQADLVALSRAAQARSRLALPPADPAPPRVESGSLVIVGGGGMPAGLVKCFIELAGGPDAPLVVVPCTDQEVVLEDSFVEVLRKAGANDVTLVHTKDRRKASSDDDFLAPLKRAQGDLVWRRPPVESG